MILSPFCYYGILITAAQYTYQMAELIPDCLKWEHWCNEKHDTGGPSSYVIAVISILFHIALFVSYRRHYLEVQTYNIYFETLSMLYCFKDYKRCIHISHHIQQKNTKFTREQPYLLPIWYYQYLARWCPGDLRSQGINRFGIDRISRNILSLASKELTVGTSSIYVYVCIHTHTHTYIYI